MSPGSIALGVDTSATSPTPGGHSRQRAQGSRRRRGGVLAERVGLEHFALGEHHREDMPASAPDVVLAAIAARTERIKIGSAVTVSAPTTGAGLSSATRPSTRSRAAAPT